MRNWVVDADIIRKLIQTSLRIYANQPDPPVLASATKWALEALSMIVKLETSQMFVSSSKLHPISIWAEWAAQQSPAAGVGHKYQLDNSWTAHLSSPELWPHSTPLLLLHTYFTVPSTGSRWHLLLANFYRKARRKIHSIEWYDKPWGPHPLL